MLVLVFVVRLTTLGSYQVANNTEAQYADIARKMIETDIGFFVS